jgi:hypothetical protein
VRARWISGVFFLVCLIMSETGEGYPVVRLSTCTGLQDSAKLASVDFVHSFVGKTCRHERVSGCVGTENFSNKVLFKAYLNTRGSPASEYCSTVRIGIYGIASGIPHEIAEDGSSFLLIPILFQSDNAPEWHNVCLSGRRSSCIFVLKSDLCIGDFFIFEIVSSAQSQRGKPCTISGNGNIYIVAMSNYNREDSDSSGNAEDPIGHIFAICLLFLVAFFLIAIGLMLSRHAIYNCRYRDDGSYVFFVLFSEIPLLCGVLLLATIFGFFPDSPLPHLSLF